jgi:hypothetical protein
MLDTAPQRSGTANLRIIIAVCAEALKKCRSLEGVGPGTRAQINAAYEMAASEIHKGRRSLPDHRRLFAIIARLYDNWPEDHDFQPEDAENLRAWLICKAGAEWRDATRFELPEDATDHMQVLFRLGIEAAIRASGGRAFVVPHGRGLALVTPKSMSWSRMDQTEFRRLRSSIEDVIEAETGIRVATLEREKEAA